MKNNDETQKRATEETTDAGPGPDETEGGDRGCNQNNRASVVGDIYFRLLFEHSDDAILLTAPDGTVLSANPAACRMFGRTEGEICRLGRKVLVDPADHRLPHALKERERTGVYRGELTCLKSDGQPFPCFITSVLFRDPDGQPKTSLIIRDITEQKQMQEDLRTSERTIRMIADSVPALVAYVDKKGFYRFANRRYDEWFGIPAGDVIGKHYRDVLGSQTYEDIRPYVETVLSGTAVSFDRPLSYLHGGERWIHADYVPDFGNEGNVEGYFGLVTDITEQKRAERLREESQRFVASIMDSLESHIAVIDENGTVIAVNRPWRAFADSNPPVTTNVSEGADYLAVCDSATGEDRDLARTFGDGIRSVLRGERDRFSLDYPCHSPDEKRWFTGTVTRFIGPGPLRAVIAHENITKRKVAEESLRNAEIRYRTVADFTNDWETWENPDGSFCYISPACERITGYGPSEFLRLPDLFAALIVDEDKGVWEGHRRHRDRSSEPAEVQFRIRRTDGELRWIEHVCRPVYDDKGVFLGYRAGNRDITRRKRAEEVLRERERQMATLLTNLPGMAYRCLNDREWTMLVVSEGCFALTGYRPEDLIGNKGVAFNDLVLPEFRERLWKKWQTLLSARLPFEDEYPIRTASDEIKWVWERGRGIFGEDGGLLFLEGYIEDVTERRTSEENLRLDEKRLESLLRISQYHAETVQEFLDFALEEAIALTQSKIGYIYFYNEQTGQFTLNTWSKDVMKECRIANPQTLYELDKTGLWGEAVRQRKPIIVNAFGTPHPLKKGYPEGHATLATYLTIPVFSGSEIVAVVGVANKDSDYDESDIRQLTLLMSAVWRYAEQEGARSALKQSEAKYRSIFDKSVEGIFQTTPEGQYLTANPALAKMYGYDSAEEMIADVSSLGKQVYVNPEDRIRLRKLYQEQGYVRGYEIQMYTRDKRQIWVSMNARAAKDDHGTIRYFEGTVEDITARKMAEEQLIQTTEKLRKSLAGTIQAISSMVETRDPYTAGHQRRVSSLARAIAQEMNLSADTVDAIRIAGAIHDIGKMAIPAEILSKPGKLTGIEMKLIEIHPRRGYEIIEDAGLQPPIADIVHQHHERVDGSGYPQGLTGDQILLEAQVLAVADVVEAIASHRPYRPAHGIGMALDEIEKNKGIRYDEKVVDACLTLFREKGFAFDE